jgi:hypothetical protein
MNNGTQFSYIDNEGEDFIDQVTNHIITRIPQTTPYIPSKRMEQTSSFSMSKKFHSFKSIPLHTNLYSFQQHDFSLQDHGYLIGSGRLETENLSEDQPSQPIRLFTALLVHDHPDPLKSEMSEIYPLAKYETGELIAGNKIVILFQYCIKLPPIAFSDPLKIFLGVQAPDDSRPNVKISLIETRSLIFDKNLTTGIVPEMDEDPISTLIHSQTLLSKKKSSSLKSNESRNDTPDS